MGNKVSPGVTWVVDETTGVVAGQRRADGTVVPLATIIGSGGGIVFASASISASAVVKGVANDPGNLVGIFCVSVAGGKVTMRDGGTVGGALISGYGSGGASGLTMTAGSYYSLGAAVYCPNGIFMEINGTGTYIALYQ